jgi:heat shock protein 5
VNVEALVDGVDLSETLTRAKFEELNRDLFLRVVEPSWTYEVVSQAEQLGGKNRESIDEVVLIGGSTMIPKVKELVRDYFDGKKELTTTELKPDEAVAFGAAMLSHPSAGGYPCMGVNNRYQIGVPSDNCYAYDYTRT